ncbi:DinB family protein [Nocardioides euryhalodurans]|uniref:DinB family protein n=1 Tax=Nocardioides euryhalodurans TaxID=2518370 RepID=A0A4P7GL62_9ACTN|nr:DinB family protein [Nocardioides euryhalodurans]QBR92770.1 DinB family protein [Nocardioides euryhalodurans]
MAETFSHRDLTGATFEHVDLTGARFRAVDLSGVVMRGVDLVDVQISGEVRHLVVNGVDVAPLVEAELVRRHPELALMRPDDAAGFRRAWDVLEGVWEETLAHARRLPPEQLHASVDGEWSFVETLRHLVYATDVWVRRAMLGDPRPWHPLSLPFDEMTPHSEVPWDREARPSLDEVLELRRDRQATVRRVLEQLTDEQLAGDTEPVEGPSWPPAARYPVAEVLWTVLNEEFWHRQYAERDLAVLEERAGSARD